MGVLKLHGLKVFSKRWRQEYLPQLAGGKERRMILCLYAQHDHAVAQWKETLKEVERAGKTLWEVGEFERIPGVGPIAAHVFSAIIEEPGRFKTSRQLWKYRGIRPAAQPALLKTIKEVWMISDGVMSLFALASAGGTDEFFTAHRLLP